MANFTGTLNINEFISSIYNAYRLIGTYADNLSALNGDLADKWKYDGGMYTDKSVWTAGDVLDSDRFHIEDSNILAPGNKILPRQFEITVNRTRQINLYIEQYLSRKAWMDPEAFNAFQATVEAQVSKTKRLYEALKANVYAGTVQSAVGSQTQTITFPTISGTSVEDPDGTPVDTEYADVEKLNRLQAQMIAEKIANAFVDLADPSTDYNDYGHLDCFKEGDFDIVFNSKWYNRILKIDMPTIFSASGLKDVTDNVIVKPAKYFGDIVTSSATADGSTHRSLEEYKIRVDSNGEYDATGTTLKLVRPGDLLPKSTPIVAPSTAETTGTGTFTYRGTSQVKEYYSTVHAYVENAKKVCKLIHKDAPKYLSSYEVGSEFVNPKNHTVQKYLTWNYADIDRLPYLPVVSINEA